MTGKAINYTPQYSSAQKTQIANSLLEFYKDGKYAFDKDKSRQCQGYYNHKSEITNNLDNWCNTQSAFVKYIIPIIDYNLETDYDALETEWVKHHQTQCKLDDVKSELKRLKESMEYMAERRAQELKKEWVSDVEDVVKLQNALDESEQKRINYLRQHSSRCKGWDNKENQLKETIERLTHELRSNRDKQIEEELERKTKKAERDKELETAISDRDKANEKMIKMKEKCQKEYEKKREDIIKKEEKKMSNLQKELDALIKKDMKNENLLLKSEKIKLELDMFKMKYKEMDTQYTLSKSENATLRQMVAGQSPVPQIQSQAQESLPAPQLIRSV